MAPTWEKEYKSEWLSFLKCIARAWTGELNSCTKVCKEPLYTLAMCKHKSVLEKDPRTNNVHS